MNEQNQDDIEQKLDRLARQISGTSLVDGVMRRVGEAAIAPAEPEPCWRGIIRRHWRSASTAAAALLAIAALAVIAIVGRTPTPAYAVQQTIEAIEEIETVHFRAELYKQGNVECWMAFDGVSAKPIRLSLSRQGSPVRIVDGPDGSFIYNERTNLVFPKVRDERDKDWHPDFAGLFQQALLAAEESGSIQVSSEFDTLDQREVIVIDVDEGSRTCRYYIDPDTKLPVRFTTTTTQDLRELMRSTIAVKNMDLIEYNQPIPEGLFEVPTDAQAVTNEHDIIWYPEVGLLVDGLSPQDACVKLMDEILDAMNAYDFERVQQLFFPFVVPPQEVVEKMKAGAAGRPVVELLELGEPYEQGEYWHLRVKTREANGKVKDEVVPIRFYEFEGHTYCMVTQPD